VSKRDGGTPQPLIGADDPHADPLLACIAVRFAGYWAEGLATIASTRSQAQEAAAAELKAMLREIRPGVPPEILATAAIRTLRERKAKLHPFVGLTAGNGIGLSREEAPILAMGEPTQFDEGDICTLRAGAQIGAEDSAIVSAMILIGTGGAEILWRG
jgi:Xaa-Pro aminopeptidase